MYKLTSFQVAPEVLDTYMLYKYVDPVRDARRYPIYLHIRKVVVIKF